MKKDNIGYYSGLDCLNNLSQYPSDLIEEWLGITSPGPAPMPARMAAPIKLEYDLASARQIKLPILIRVDVNNTNLRPKVVLRGTLD